MKNNNKKKGFTLTEVLVVVLVIAVLAAIAYPMYTRSITKSKAVEAINLLEMVRNKQLQKFARDHEYYTDLSKITQLTSDSSLVTVEGETLKVNGYVLSVNPDKNCMSAYYKKGNTEFTLSTSYETAGLGCSGDICKSFGDIVGSASDVCGCTKTCDNGFTLDKASCSCECNLGCATAGSCSSPSLSLPTTQSCGNGGSQTRVCTPSCNGGDCGAWGSCTSQTCEESLKPAASQSCGTCGTQSRTVSCNNSTGGWQTGAWSACNDSCSCAAGSTYNKTLSRCCSAYDNTVDIKDGGCCQENPSCGSGGPCKCLRNNMNCDEKQKPAASQACGNCGLGTQTRDVSCDTSTYTWATTDWGTCTGGGECAAGDTQTCGGGNGKATCSSSCKWSSCVCTNTAEITKCTNAGGKWDSDTCTCSGGNACGVPQSDIAKCQKACPNPRFCYWDAANCCCVATKNVAMIEGTMCTPIPLCSGGEISSAEAVCEQYGTSSAECICANGNVKQCFIKVYGSGSDEAKCVASGYNSIYCQCDYFSDFARDYRNYACIGTPAKCPGEPTPRGSFDCCCLNGKEVANPTGSSVYCNSFKPPMMGCRCKDDYCQEDPACSDCGGTWNSVKCSCDCGFYNGNSCKFVAGSGCLCGNLWKKCR